MFRPALSSVRSCPNVVATSFFMCARCNEVQEKHFFSLDWRNPGKELDFYRVCPIRSRNLTLLLMQEVRAREVRRDDIHFQGLRYLSPL